MSTSEEAPVEFQNVSKLFRQKNGQPFYANRNLSFRVRQGEVVAIVGETGCGKSTSFQMLLGLLRPDEGQVRVLGYNPFNQHSGLLGAVGIVFQNDRLLPWRTAADNVAFGLEVLRVPTAERLAIAHTWLDRVGLKGFEHAYPHELSGGMRQRVSIARAFAIGPKVLYADEAFTALDELTAARIRNELLALVKETRITTLFITHSVPEAVDVAQRILVFGRPGKVVREINRDGALAQGKSVRAIEEMVREGLAAAHTPAVAEVGAADLCGGIGAARAATNLVADPPQRLG